MNKLEKIIYDYFRDRLDALILSDRHLKEISKDLAKLISKHITEEIMKILGVTE